MATTSFIYHALGLVRYDHLKTEYKNGAVYHHVKRKYDERYCAGCNASWHHLRMDGRFERSFLALPIGRRHQYVVLHGHEQNCSVCGKTLREPIPFAYALRRYLENGETELFDIINTRADRYREKTVGIRHYTSPGCICKICEQH